MSFIDVTDVLFDPEIAGQSFSVLRREEGVNFFGEVVITPTLVPGLVGCVYPTGENSLIREVAAQSQANTLTFVTTYRLRPASKTPDGRSWQPDYVLWQDDWYIVWTLNEFTQYGAGFLVADCMAIDYQTVAPLLKAAQVGRLDFSQPAQSGLAAVLANDPPKEE